MKSTKYQPVVLAVLFSLLAILAVYAFADISNETIFAYPAPDATIDATNGYPGPGSGDTNTYAYPGPDASGNNLQGDECLPVDPGLSSISAKDRCATPAPLPTPTPTPNPGVDGLTGMTASLTFEDNSGEITYQLISPSLEQLPNLTVTTASLTYNGPLPTSPPTMPQKQSTTTDDLVDNWDLLFVEGFEGAFPQSGCVVFDNNPGDGFERYWGAHDRRPLTGSKAGWPAAGGNDAVSPDLGIYPDNLDSWFVCGPFDLSQAEKFIVEHSFWLEIFDVEGNDRFIFAVSTNGSQFQGLAYSGVQGWLRQQVHITGIGGQPAVWVAWVFQSDAGGPIGEGVWVDDIEIWRYNTPDIVCGNYDPGNKGIVLPPYDPTANSEVPMIRPGDTLAVNALKTAGVNWVRLGFIHQDGIVDWQGYDRMIDTLCANGITVLGLINHETLLRQDYNDPGSAESYRQEFAAQAGFLADYYQGRIRYWEIWNEQNLPDFLQGAFVLPELYAPLLREAFIAIVNANYQARILFGGLASAWGDSNDYFAAVYQSLNEDWGGSRPFDYFAVHPYARVNEGPNPQIYMYAVDDPTHHTIIDQFLKTMFDNNDSNKRIWITEVGWNSSKESPTRPVCLDPVLVYETEQAAYLKPMFDILFNEVSLWNNPSVKAVEKVVWYQYMDVGTPDPCVLAQSGDRHAYVSFDAMSSTNSGVDWWFGLYRGDKVTPKEARCAYLAYPQTCDEFFSHRIYLPLVVRQ